jgi:hypothetical protein
MGIPTEEELKTALTHAAQMREQGEDLYFMAKSLLNFNYRMKYLNDVLAKADMYLHSGEGAREHSELLNAIELAKEASSKSSEEDENIHPW